MTLPALYLLKVILCSGLLFLYYFLCLRNRLFHQWNRFYLLTTVVLSLLVPLVAIPVQHTPVDTSEAIQLLQVMQSGDARAEFMFPDQNAASANTLFFTAYVLVSICFAAAFCFSLLRLRRIIRSHPAVSFHKIRLVDTALKGTPFSFLQYIFWNRNIDLASETGRQIFRHELAHVFYPTKKSKPGAKQTIPTRTPMP